MTDNHLDFEKTAFEEGLQLQKDISLSGLTNWKIGGPAKYFIDAKNKEDIIKSFTLSKKFKIANEFLGGGTNVLISDSGFNGLIIKISTNQVQAVGDTIQADAGAAMGRVAAVSMQHNLQGLEWAVGIPGTVGGAIFGNSNCFGGSTGKNLEAVELLTPAGEVIRREKNYFCFGYDYSTIQHSKEIVLSAIFKLKSVSSEEMKIIRAQMAELAKHRHEQQPLGEKSAGSTFKAVTPTPDLIKKISLTGANPEQCLRDGFISAGFIIDKCLSLKGYKSDQMQISPKHANFFINLGGATAQNAKDLIDFVKKECKNKIGINLEEEIRYIGFH